MPGYRAPADTVDPAVRIALIVLQILADAVEFGCVLPRDNRPIPPVVRADRKSIHDTVALGDQHLAALTAWTLLIGGIVRAVRPPQQRHPPLRSPFQLAAERHSPEPRSEGISAAVVQQSPARPERVQRQRVVIMNPLIISPKPMIRFQ